MWHDYLPAMIVSGWMANTVWDLADSVHAGICQDTLGKVCLIVWCKGPEKQNQSGYYFDQVSHLKQRMTFYIG